MRVTITRDYGETADEKPNELLWHLLIAVAAVVLFLGLTLGVRPAMVVSLAIPVTLSLTLFTSMLIGYTHQPGHALCPDFFHRHLGG